MSDVDIQYTLDPSGYLIGANQIVAANAQIQQSMVATSAGSLGLSKALSLVTPGRAAVAGLSLFTKTAADAQQQMSGLEATATVTGVSMGKLGQGVRQLARDLPIGRAGATQIVEQFTKMGVSAAGSEDKILRLAKASAQLGGATGENMSGLAQGLTELSRATGNQNLDPKRFQALGDSLTTVSAKMGSSATGTLQFAKAIAPMAQQAGIGSTSILGISAAFSRLGEDGLAASNAVNKMLSDMSRSVREGSPEMRTYAQIAGMTADSFERMYKAKPTEAVTRVLTSIAQAGPGGPRMLEQIGIEGVRGQRAIQALVASGGLQPAITAAQQAYGSGSTAKAAEAAFGGLNDAMTELHESTKQVAEAFGRPLLGPLTTFSRGLSSIVGMFANLANNPVGQALLGGAVGLGGAALLGRTSTRILGSYGLARQGLTSGPMRSLAAGFAGGAGLGPESRLGRFGMPMELAAQTGEMGPVSEFLYNITTGLGQMVGGGRGRGGAGVPGGPSLRERLRTTAKAYGYNAAQSLATMTVEQTANALELDPTQRRQVLGLSGGFRYAGERARQAYAASREGGAGILGSATESVKGFDKALKSTTDTTSTFKGTLKSIGEAAHSQLQLAGALTGDLKGAVGRAGGGVGRGLMTMLGGGAGLAGLGITAGIGVISAGMGSLDKERQERAAVRDQEINSSFNAYRDSIGKATEATSTIASIQSDIAANLAQGAKSETIAQVLGVSDSDVQAARSSLGKITQRFAGTTAQIGAQIQLMHPTGLAPDELQAVKVDLLRQFDKSTVQEIMKGLPANIATGMAGPGGAIDVTKQAQATVAAVNQQAGFFQRNAQGGLGGIGTLSSLVGQAGNEMNTMYGKIPGIGGLMQAINIMPGGGLNRFIGGGLSDQQKQTANLITQGVSQAFKENQKFGSDYAIQQLNKEITPILQKSIATGNVAETQYLMHQFAPMLSSKDLTKENFSIAALRGAGGDLTKVIADYDPEFAKTRKAILERTRAGGELKPVLQVQDYVGKMYAQDFFGGQAFDPRLRAKNPIAEATSAFLEAPESIEKFSKAIDTFTTGAVKSGQSWGDIVISSQKLAKTVAPGGDQDRLLKAIQAQAEQQMAFQQAQMTPQAARAQRVAQARRQLELPVTTETEFQAQQQARGTIQQAALEGREEMVNYLKQVRAMGIQEQRMNEDNHRAILYANQDFNRQRERMERNFNLQMERMTHQYNLSVQRAEEDFNISRERQLRDFHISMARAEEDYQTARARQIRDFNIQLARQIEDAAKTLYDPYARIQTKATWDAQNLLENMAEQTAAITKQKQQLDQMRGMGLSAQAIDILGLGKTENAQQLAQLTQDALNNPQVIAQINAAAEARAKASTTLVTDASNKELVRQREDLNRNLADAAADHKKAVKRANEDLAKGLADASADFHRAMKRNAADFVYSTSQARIDYNNSLKDMETDLATSLKRQSEALNTATKRMHEDLKEANTQIAGTNQQIADAAGKAIAGKAVNWSTITVNGMQGTIDDMSNKIIPQLKTLFAPYGVTIPDPPKKSSGSNAYDPSGTHQRAGGTTKNAMGGRIGGYSPTTTADNIPIWATAGEYMHPVDAVSYYGVNTMEALRNKRIPRELMEGYATGGLIEFGRLLQKKGYAVSEHPKFGGVHPVHVAGSEHYNKKGPGGGGAIDVNADPWNTKFKNEKSALDAIVGLAQLYNLRTIWQSPGHYNHAHFDIAKGPDIVASYVRVLIGRAVFGELNAAARAALASGGGMAALKQILHDGFDWKRAGPYTWVAKAIVNQVLRSDIAKLLGAGPGGGPGPAGDTGAHSANAVANQDIARALLGNYGWGPSQMTSLIKLWNGESGWNQFADNPTSDAYGIPQALPGSKMSSAGADWRTNPRTQILWGLNYIKGRYGTPDQAWATWSSRSPHWYDAGGWLKPGATNALNSTGSSEAVLTKDQWDSVRRLAAVGADDLHSMHAHGGAHLEVHDSRSYSYDQRNDFSGAEIVVKADDPAQMAAQLEAKAKAARLTQTRSVVRNR